LSQKAGIRYLFDPLDPGRGKKKIRIRIRDKHRGSYLRELKKQFFALKYLKFFDVDPEWKNSDPGSGINIPDPQN
jgi:hypothetical protein